MKLRDVKLTIIGFGEIGRGVARVLLEKKGFIERNYGVDLDVIAICEIDGSIIDENGIDLRETLRLAEDKKLKEHKNWSSMRALDVIKKIKSDIVLELTPSNIESGQPGLRHIKESLRRGMHVVTSNKAPLALKFSELQKIAKSNKVKLKYEATVGGALPVINLRKHALQINKIESIHGILNGTTNYILTKMAEEGVTMDVALREAQEVGIAEADPGYDIRGIDTGAKVAILANSLMDMEVSFRDIEITGIEDITPEAIELAKKHNCVIKLIGDVNRLEVSPRLIPVNHPLNVSGALNAIMIHADVARNITVVGHGAGGIETASSLFSDILSILE
ncbi:MAG: homoserine dehydrogenase [Candidatus Altiarchaeales archaeon ex4484_43]|nr:MAG: homoserine dehydrogenase [Candidatus Altiarchaeales archaeon ex4484_43]